MSDAVKVKWSFRSPSYTLAELDAARLSEADIIASRERALAERILADASPRSTWPVRFVALALAAFFLAGCGAGALTHHSTAAVVLGSVHRAAEGVADSAIIAEVQACAQDDACIAAVRERWTPAKVALVSVHAAIALYRESIRVAQAAQSGEALEALRLALRSILESDLPRAFAALASVGVELPPQVAVWVEVARSALLALLGGGS